MDIINYIIPILFILGLIQGLVSGVLLLWLNRKENRSTLFLGIFILAFSIDYLAPISEHLNITAYYPQLNFLFDFRWLMLPLFYLYVSQVSILPKSRNMYYYLIPWVVMFIFSLLTYFKVIKGIENLWNSAWFMNFYYMGSNVFDIFMAVKIVLFINNHSVETRNQYTSTKLKELKWAKLFVVSGVGFFLVMHIRLAVNDFYLDLFEALVNVGFLYWISIHGIRQKNVLSLTSESDITETESNTTGKIANPSTKQVTNENIALVEKIEQYIIEEKAFLIPDITIADISQGINEHPKRVSLAINVVAKKNFKSFVNSFRIAESKRLLEDESSANLSVEGIGLEVGFKSKSVFYSAFKKETGVTPSNYKNQQKSHGQPM